MTTVLIGFADSLPAPEVLWSLIAFGFRVNAFAKKGTTPALRKSRFVTLEYVTDPAKCIEQSLADLREVVERLDTPVLMGVDDSSLWLIRELAMRMPLRVAGPVGHMADVALDKRLQLNAATTAGFSIPMTRELNSREDLNELSFPVIVKPAFAARNIQGSLGRSPSYTIANSRALSDFAVEWNESEPMLAQERLSGVGEGVFGFAIDDGVVCWFGHRRIRMMNPSGSGSSACMSATPDRQVCVIAERFLKSIEWRGLFMIELLREASGRVCFMELNGRPWGSMALARRLGYEYPGWAVLRLLDPRFVPTAPTEARSILCRHLGREILHLAFVCRNRKSHPEDNWPSPAETFRRVCRLSGNEHWYNHNIADPKVFWADTGQTLSASWTRFGWFSKIARRLRVRLKRSIVRYEQATIRARGNALKLLCNCKRILFVCYGNINRSALAEQHMRQLVGSRVGIFSCGFHTPAGRAVDPMMQSLATEYGICFPVWSSRTINHELVATADVIFAMEAAHLVRLFSQYPETRGRAFLLGCVTKPNTIPLEIQDPYGGTPDAYRRCIQEVTYATTTIAERLRAAT